MEKASKRHPQTSIEKGQKLGATKSLRPDLRPHRKPQKVANFGFGKWDPSYGNGKSKLVKYFSKVDNESPQIESVWFYPLKFKGIQRYQLDQLDK